MKIIRFTADGATRVGVLDGETVVELPGVADTQALIAGGAGALEAARKAVASGAGRRPLAGVGLAAPIVPSTILCSGSNYTDHNKEKANTPISGKEPEFFVKTADCVIGPGDTIVHDERLTKKLDAETELAIVIGRPGRHIPVERALEHVFGYTVANDVTARELQVRRNEQGFTWYEVGRGKAFETACPLGPCIVTADEIPDPQQLRLRTRINGELRQSASTGNMIFSCAHLIHFFSTSFTLKPGFVILTGTPGGTAWSTDPELGGKWVGGDGSETLVPAKGYLKPGDAIENELEKIGILRNAVGTA
jgi:2-keto-4-pentenoate hydratase/2-oxohepta-3-ene-1,7-dioic acid hydratase in catechol pathway